MTVQQADSNECAKVIHENYVKFSWII